MKQKTHRYAMYVEWSDEDQVFIGRCPEVMGGGVHGTDPKKVFKELVETVDEIISDAQKNGPPLPEPLATKTFSGKFILRTSPDLHRRLAVRALGERDSLNNYIVKRLEEVA